MNMKGSSDSTSEKCFRQLNVVCMINKTPTQWLVFPVSYYVECFSYTEQEVFCAKTLWEMCGCCLFMLQIKLRSKCNMCRNLFALFVLCLQMIIECNV